MKRVDPLLIGLAICTVGALGLITWPLPSGSKRSPQTDVTYREPEHQTLAVAAPSDAPAFRLSTSGAPAVPVPVSSAPVLVGVAGGREAYLKSSASAEITRVRPGDVVDGWRVASVDERSVTVVLGSEQRRLLLFARPEQPEQP